VGAGSTDALPGFAFVWRFVTAFAFVGSLVAYRRKRRDHDSDPFPIRLRWGILGACSA
jgi:hypothetical protein